MSLETRLREKRQKLGETTHAMRALLDKADAEKRDLTAEEQNQFDAMNADIEGLEKDIERTARALDLEKRAAEPVNAGVRPGADNRSVPPASAGAPAGGAAEPEPEQRALAFQAFLRRGLSALTEEEARSLSAGADAEGGFLVAPQQFMATLLKKADAAVAIRSLATVYPLAKAESVGVPTLDSDVDDWDWTPELKTGKDDKGLKFGKRELRPHPVGKRIKVSRALIRLATLDVQSIVTDRMVYKLAATMEKAYMTGDGSQKPLGLFTASAQGISTSRDTAIAGIATDALIDIQESLHEAYDAGARWLFHPDRLKEIRKLKDGEDQYVWQPGLQAGMPNLILGKPYVRSRFAPNATGSGKYLGMYGDFSKYWIVDSLALQIQVLYELYAETNQIGYIGRYEGDGMPVLEEAFVRIKQS